MPMLKVERIVIEGNRMKVDVALQSGAPHRTDQAIAGRALEAVPSLGLHACVNSAGPTFASVIQNTSIPHLLEHLIIDRQVRDDATLTEQSFVGATEWVDERAGKAHIEMSFFDDLVALRALKGAVAQLEEILAIRPTEQVSER